MEESVGASASKPRSWSCYDRARRQRRRTDETNVSSVAPNDSRRRDPADGIPERTSVDASARADAPSSSAAAAAVSAAVASALREAATVSTERTEGVTGRPRRRGIDALSVPAADGVATTLRFQWVRLHPSDAFLLVAASAAAAEADGDGGDYKEGKGERPSTRRFGWGHDMPSPSAELSGMVYYPGRSRKRRRAVGKEEEASGNNGEARRSENGGADEAEGGARRSSYQTRREHAAVGNGNGGDCVASDIRVDASDLCFDPPLLTEWLPGVETSCSYDVGDTTDDSSSSSSGEEEGVKDESSAAKGEDKEGDGGDSSSRSSSTAVMELLGEIMAVYRSSGVGAATTEDDDDVRRERRLRVLLSPLASLPPLELSGVLPSHLLVKAVSECQQRKNPNRDGKQHAAGASDEESRRTIGCLTLALVALCSLAGACPRDDNGWSAAAMGRHILRVLSPVALDPSSYHRRSTVGGASGPNSGGGAVEQQPPVLATLTRENEGLVRRLANLLVSNGGLGELSRSELRALLSSAVVEEEEEDDDDRPGSELMDELRCCVSEAFLS